MLRTDSEIGDMTRDELEFSISQYLDGTLPARETDALESRLGSDAEARALFAEYESLQGVLAAAPLPAVRWDRFAEQVSAAVAREEMPAHSYQLSRWLRPARLAIAASVLVAGAIGFSLLNRGGPSGDTGAPVTAGRVEPFRIVKVDGAGTATPTAVVSPGSMRVAVGPPQAADGRRYADTVVRRPSRAVIVSPASLGQDSPPTPF